MYSALVGFGYLQQNVDVQVACREPALSATPRLPVATPASVLEGGQSSPVPLGVERPEPFARQSGVGGGVVLVPDCCETRFERGRPGVPSPETATSAGPAVIGKLTCL